MTGGVRPFVAAVLILLGALAATASVPVQWATSLVHDSRPFVQTLGPLGRDAGVQSLLADAVTDEVMTRLDASGLGPVALPPGLSGLGGAGRPAVERLVAQTVTGALASAPVVSAWPDLIRNTHAAVARDLTHAPVGGTAASDRSVTADGRLSIDVSPIAQQARAQLVSSGLTLAGGIDVGQVRVRVGPVPGLASGRTYVSWLDRALPALPIAAGVLLALGVAAARRRIRALVRACLAVAVGVSLALLGVALIRGPAVERLSGTQLSSSTSLSIYAGLTADLVAGLLTVLGASLALAVIVAIVARAVRPRRG